MSGGCRVHHSDIMMYRRKAKPADSMVTTSCCVWKYEKVDGKSSGLQAYSYHRELGSYLI